MSIVGFVNSVELIKYRIAGIFRGAEVFRSDLFVISRENHSRFRFFKKQNKKKQTWLASKPAGLVRACTYT